MDNTDKGQTNGEETPVAVPTTEQTAEEVKEPTLPDQVKERTAEEFEKLKEHNRQLSEELKTLKVSKPSSTVFDELRPNLGTAALPPVPQQVNQPLVDDGGYVDATLLNSTISENQKKAEEAKSIALQTQEQIQRFQETQQQKEVAKEFPEFDANSDQFDPTFYNFVKNELVGQLISGQSQDLHVAAIKAREVLGKKTVTPEPRKETISSREQASATTGTAKGTPQEPEHDALVRGTYKGDKEAIFKRLQASGN